MKIFLAQIYAGAEIVSDALRVRKADGVKYSNEITATQQIKSVAIGIGVDFHDIDSARYIDHISNVSQDSRHPRVATILDRYKYMTA